MEKAMEQLAEVLLDAKSDDLLRIYLSLVSFALETAEAAHRGGTVVERNRASSALWDLRDAYEKGKEIFEGLQIESPLGQNLGDYYRQVRSVWDARLTVGGGDASDYLAHIYDAASAARSVRAGGSRMTVAFEAAVDPQYGKMVEAMAHALGAWDELPPNTQAALPAYPLDWKKAVRPEQEVVGYHDRLTDTLAGLKGGLYEVRHRNCHLSTFARPYKRLPHKPRHAVSEVEEIVRATVRYAGLLGGNTSPEAIREVAKLVIEDLK